LVYPVVAGADKATPAKSPLKMIFLVYILDDRNLKDKLVVEKVRL
jgi:hypothetical protein